MAAKSDRTRLLDKIDKHANAQGCWRWVGASNPTTGNYGNVRDGAHVVPAHRAAAKVLGGKSIAGRDVHHVCGNRWCCNPAHLKVMSHARNMAADKERRAKGG
jgi:hypothetical protein